MIATKTTVCLGTRGSALARRQTDHVRGLLLTAWPWLEVEIDTITTRGDRVLDTPLPLMVLRTGFAIGGKGLFTAELEAALRAGDIDLAVHSLKDLPTELPPGLTVGAIPARANPADALISRRGHSVETLPCGARVGTSSRRRAAQLLHRRPDLTVLDIRGNVDTRLRKALDPDGPYDAVVLACAGLERLGRDDAISQVLPLELMMPAPGQGALAVQCRDEAHSLALLAPIHDATVAAAVTAERAFLAGLGGGCAVPVAAYAEVKDGTLTLRGRVTAVDGSCQVDVSAGGHVTQAEQLGIALAHTALAQGAAAILETTT